MLNNNISLFLDFREIRGLLSFHVELLYVSNMLICQYVNTLALDLILRSNLNSLENREFSVNSANPLEV